MPAVSPPPPIDEGPSPFVQQNVPRKKAITVLVHYLDDTEHTFYVYKKAKGSVLIDMVIAHIALLERDYFGLAFYDEQRTQHWLYADKKIARQLKKLNPEFFFKVKFYPPQPNQLTEDFTRHLLYLQLRTDVYTEHLPVSFAAQVSLGSLVAQAVLGDYKPMNDYVNHINNAKIAQPTLEQEQFINHVREMHKLHRGLTQQEAELAYLNECKSLAMYGLHLFSAKDSKSKLVQIGVSSHGISVFNDQMRVNRFAWPGIVKISYRRSIFSIRLKAGELDPKKEMIISYTLDDYEHVKLLWKCAVEHHGFFRLVQPEPKQKNSFLNFGSTRFRYTGRTNIQSQMASQLFETTPIAATNRVISKASEMLSREQKDQHSAPLNFVDEPSPQKQLAHDPLSIKNNEIAKKENGAKKEKKKKANKKDKKQKKNLTAGAEALSTSTSSNSSTSSSSEAEAEKVHILEQQKSDAHPKKHIVEGSAAPGHTTVETWHEETVGPEQVTTEIDEQENIIKRIVRSEQIKHTVQTQSYQTVIVPENDAEELSKIGTEISSPVLNSGMLNGGRNENDLLTQDELVSSKVITTGNRTVETLTYKTEKNGIVETRVEHRITIHSNEEIDHDAELGEAIMEVTNMNPELKVEKVQVERSDGSA